jgi:hypothetical protein
MTTATAEHQLASALTLLKVAKYFHSKPVAGRFRELIIRQLRPEQCQLCGSEVAILHNSVISEDWPNSKGNGDKIGRGDGPKVCVGAEQGD